MLYCKHTFITNNIHKGKVCYVWNRMPGTKSLTSHTEFSFNCVQPYIQGTAETVDAVAETEITWSLTRTVGTSTLLARPPSLFSIIITILGNSRVTGIVCRRYYFLTELFCIAPPFFEFRLFDRTAIGWLIHGSELSAPACGLLLGLSMCWSGPWTLRNAWTDWKMPCTSICATAAMRIVASITVATCRLF